VPANAKMKGRLNVIWDMMEPRKMYVRNVAMLAASNEIHGTRAGGYVFEFVPFIFVLRSLSCLVEENPLDLFFLLSD
jgi:hypothetical protein